VVSVQAAAVAAVLSLYLALASPPPVDYGTAVRCTVVLAAATGGLWLRQHGRRRERRSGRPARSR
jgi:hypothetical protein